MLALKNSVVTGKINYAFRGILCLLENTGNNKYERFHHNFVPYSRHFKNITLPNSEGSVLLNNGSPQNKNGKEIN